MKTSKLSEQQLEVVQSRDRNTLTVAGPGSGKTRTLVERIKSLILSGCDPAGIVAITFTNAGARELIERLVCCEPPPDGVDTAEPPIFSKTCPFCSGAGTFPLGYVGTLHSFMLRLIRENFKVVGFTASPGVIGEEQSDRLIEEIYEEMKVKGVSLRQMIDEISEPSPRGRHPGKLQLLADAYFARLRESNLVDFHTILRYGADIVRLNPKSVSWIRNLFVDEYQDSSTLDAEIYASIMKNEVRPNTFNAFGDPDQAIYSFRGGNIKNILGMVTRPDCFAPLMTFVLEGNYRCGSGICDHAQKLIEFNGARFVKRTVCANDRAGDMSILGHATEDDELLDVVRGLRRAAEQGVPLEECAVLLRTNWLVERFVKGLKGYGVPVAENPLAVIPPDWRKAKALISALADPDNELLAFYYYEHKFGREEAKAAKKSRTLTMHRFTLEECGIILQARWTAGASLIATLENQDITDESRLRIVTLASSLSAGCDLSDLVLAMGKEEEPGDPSPGVKVGTIHSAKGREFECVWMPALEQGIIPSRRGLAENAGEEERRLMYVGMTRAKDELTLSWSAMRRPSQPEWAKPQPTTPSQFLRELQGK